MPVRLVSQEELPEPLRGYRLNKRIGRGGFGEVWEVEAPGGLRKAAKFVFGDLNSAEEDEGRPAEQEQKALNRVKSIRHPYILSLERFDVIDGQLIIVMELADRNLWDRFRECRAQGLTGIPRDELLNYMEETAEALDLMNHQHQIQHLDVKPQNIFLVHNHVKVADFGLAKLMEKEQATVTGGITPVYAAPETFGGIVSRFCDQYSLGIVYQEMLTGTRPFNGSNTKQLLLQHLNSPPELGPLPEADRRIISRSLNKEPTDRWPSCADMVHALRHASNAAAGHGLVDLNRGRTDTPLPPGSPPAAPRRAAPKIGSGVIQYPQTGGSGSITNTPRPLVTPRLVTPQGASGGIAPAHTLQRPQIFQTGRMSTLGIAPPEKTGDGVLFPALVVAVGQTGLAVLKKLRQLVRDQYGSADAVPTLRCLYLDTDQDAIEAATQGPDALPAREVVLARLNRPAHYLQDAPIPSVENWMPPGLLYRLPKNPGPAGGVRAYGRLALCDNYRIIAQRIRQEIETFLTDDPLDRAAEETGLGVRTNRARAYVLAGLAGGTGSGMAVDLAYVLKHELRAVGYRKPEAVGIVLVPPADKSSAKSVALANTCAALAEIHHFSSGNRYQTRFDVNEAPVVDTEGPFTRCAVVPLPRAGKEREQSRAFATAARSLYLDLLTPAGRVADEARAYSAATAGQNPAAVARSFGLFRLTWPRVELAATATRRFNQRLLQRWAAKESAHLTEPIRQWLVEQWSKLQLDPPDVVARFERVVHEFLQEAPEAVFDMMIDGLRTRTPGSSRTAASAACSVLDQILKLVGKPDIEGEAPGALDVAIREADRTLVTEVEGSLAKLAVSFIEQPQYRLAGAEEALTQICERLRVTISELERTRRDMAREVCELYARLFQVIGGIGSPSALGALNVFKSSVPGELLEGLRTYAVRRLRLAQLDSALSAYRTLLANVPEYLRDVSYCRTRLGEMSQSLGAQSTDPGIGPGQLVLPDGCQTLDDAADQFLGMLPPEDILAFDQSFQKAAAKKFRGVANVCLKKDKTDKFLELLTDMARWFLDERLERTDPATMILRLRGDGPEAVQLLSDAYVGAVPPLEAETTADTVILAAPEGPAGDRLRELAAAACPEVEFIPVSVSDDVMVYRESPPLEATVLPQMAELGREAYESLLAGERTPHARVDVPWAVASG
jgi:serine/threonine protein kinase